jgi:hypothetical protein
MSLRMFIGKIGVSKVCRKSIMTKATARTSSSPGVKGTPVSNFSLIPR